MDAIGIADRNTLAGVVRMHSACNGAGLKPLIGCRLDLTDAPSLLAYPVDREGYGRLSRLLSLGKMRAEERRVRADAAGRRGTMPRASPSSPGPRTISTLSKPSCHGFATP